MLFRSPQRDGVELVGCLPFLLLPKCGRKAERKGVDTDIAPFGRHKMPQLVNKDEDAEYEEEKEHEHSGKWQVVSWEVLTSDHFWIHYTVMMSASLVLNTSSSLLLASSTCFWSSWRASLFSSSESSPPSISFPSAER